MTRRKLSENEKRWLRLFGTLNEAQQRWYVADKALDLGRGSISYLSAITGMSRTTITKAVAEVSRPRKLRDGTPGFPVRQPGGGRKKVEERDPALIQELQTILEETTVGDPMSPLKWTTKSTRAIATELTRRGHPVTWHTVGRCLHDLGYSLQANVKTIEGSQHPDRDAQFRYINRQVRQYVKRGEPVISVDTKKKELVGNFRNSGRTWRRKGAPDPVNTHDFPALAAGKGIPYGAYDIAADRAVVSVGVSHDTAEFAVESIRRWWRLDGHTMYPRAKRLLICADSGGSNGNRLRAWKVHLQRLADETGMAVTVCHYPPGTSKWNKIEHRLFSFISMSWKGQPLRSYQTMVNLISATQTRSGLLVKAVLDTTDYAVGVKISKAEFRTLNLTRHSTHPNWNYTLIPKTAS
jgi:hypothetical protein